jgi:UDPglucose 6-dehydrogenase
MGDVPLAARVPGIEVVSDPYDATQGASLLAVLTEWDEFRWLDFDRVAAAMHRRSIVDTRNLLDPAAIRRLGFEYRGVGR